MNLKSKLKWMSIFGFSLLAWQLNSTPRMSAIAADEPSSLASDEPEGLDEDELLLIELRRRALDAENFASEDVDSNELPISIQDLDSMEMLPGGLSILPDYPNFPDDNLPSESRIALGKMLYFDKRLSRDRSMSCATCHDPAKGWADGRPRANGFGGQELGRHSPTVINTAFNSRQFWDGRADSLEEQAVGPIFAAGEMNMPSHKSVLDILGSDDAYVSAFQHAYGGEPSIKNVGRAIAAFERTAVTGPSRFDQYLDGNKQALTESEKRGLILFTTTASCTACHKGPNFTDNKFHNLGLRQEGPLEVDEGRFAITGNASEKGCFKTPGLRNIEQSPPYMHDGSLANLEEVVEFYNRGGDKKKNRSKLIQPLHLSESQKEDLVEFLKSLTGSLPKVVPPEGENFGI